MTDQLKLLPDVVSDRTIRGVKMTCAARFSICQRYRFELWRKWDESKSYANFLMLNPSTATAELDDNTILRCVSYAMDWGFGAMCVTNIFAFRETDPEKMKLASDPVGHGNNEAIVEIAKAAGKVVCGWGRHGSHLGRGAAVLWLLRENEIRPHALKLNNDGSPNHPLYLKKDLQPFAI